MTQTPGPFDETHSGDATPQAPGSAGGHTLGERFGGPGDTAPIPQPVNNPANHPAPTYPSASNGQPGPASDAPHPGYQLPHQQFPHRGEAGPGIPYAADGQEHNAPGPGGGDSKPTSGGNNKKLFAVAGGSALLAALLASAATFGIVSANSGAGISTGNTTVINANPKDFADAGSVNWAATAAKVSPSVVSITVGANNQATGQGSGVILDSSGNIVTNNHVVQGASQVQVTLNNNKAYKATIVGTDPSSDLAVIRIKGASDLKPIALADDQKLVVGQPVMAVGNPLGLSGTVTTGIVSALNRPVSASEGGSSSSNSGDEVVTNAIQTSAAINPGNSGGALVNGSGELIGINSSIASLSDGTSGSGSQSGNIGIGFAIPTTVVKNISSQLIKNGKATHALLGISTTNSEVTSQDSVLAAAVVKDVTKGGAADQAGIRSGDEVIAVNGVAVTSSNALVALVRAQSPGSKVTLTIVRGGETKKVDVTLGSKESN